MICQEKGWDESHEPVCVACGNDIRVRGEAGVAVLMGEVLECHTSEGYWVAHFDCRRHEWRMATPDKELWHVRRLEDRTYVLLTSRPEWARKEPWYMA